MSPLPSTRPNHSKRVAATAAAARTKRSASSATSRSVLSRALTSGGNAANFLRPSTRETQRNTNFQTRKGIDKVNDTQGVASRANPPTTTATNPPTDAQLESSLLEAQRKNHELQLHIVQKLHHIATRKAENRHVSNMMLERLTYVWRHNLRNKATESSNQEAITTTTRTTSTATNSKTHGKSKSGQTESQQQGLHQIGERQPLHPESVGPSTRNDDDTTNDSQRDKAGSTTSNEGGSPLATATIQPAPNADSAATPSSATTNGEKTQQESWDNMNARQRRKYLQLHEYNTNRRWNRPFFTDPFGNVPEPNADTVRRRQLEQSNFFFHKSPPWSSKQSKGLEQIVQQQKQRKAQVDQASKNDDDVCQSEMDDNDKSNKKIRAIYRTDQAKETDTACSFWDTVATELEEKIPTDPKTTTAVPKTAEECRLHYKELQQSKFTKEESMKILEHVHLANPSHPDWQAVAQSLNDDKSRGDRSERSDRTAWQCFAHYHTHLRPTKVSPWSPQQDCTLFAYLAAMGPQFVWDMESAAHVAGRLFATSTTGREELPPKNNRQLLVRANQSLLNPNFHSDFWTADDERRLVLCMKIYSTMGEGDDKSSNSGDQDADEGDDNDESNAQTNTAQQIPSSTIINHVAKTHFPHRGAANVVAKWTKRMDPSLSWKPFTVKDDEAILQAVREFASRSNATETEADTSSNSSSLQGRQSLLQFLQERFPSWHNQRVYRQWMRNATNEDMLKALGNRALLKKIVKLKKPSKTGAAAAGSNQSPTSPQEEEAPADLFNPSDFVLEVVQPSTESEGKKGKAPSKKKRKTTHKA